jgi:hypothetical protein
MDELIRQAPLNIDDKKIKEIYDKNEGNVMKSLMELWELDEINENNNKQTKEQKEWNEIRNICDIFDGEMNNMMAKLRSKIM